MKHLRDTLLLTFTTIAFAIMACAPVNPRLQAPQVSLGAVEVGVSEQHQDINSKIDILFVIDNSDSMRDEQTQLVENINSFVDAFSRNATLDFHIGVTTVFDRFYYGQAGRTITPLGHLWPLYDPSIKARNPELNPFVTRDTPNYLEVLKETLRVGTMTPQEGPVHEESFSPVVAAVSDPTALTANRGFYREDAYFLVIFLTDAHDNSSTIEPSSLYEVLKKLKKEDKSKVMSYAAQWTKECGEQNRDPNDRGAAPNDASQLKIKNFVETYAHGSTFSLCSKDYGAELAKIGLQTTRKISRRVIPLNGVPDINTIEVKYGSQTIPPDYRKGWSYEPDRVALILSGELDVTPEPGAKLSIRFVPVVLANVENGRTKPLGQK